jgi:hypothetical protein
MFVCTRYHGEHKGFKWEIHFNDYQSEHRTSWWTSYFYIKPDQVDSETWELLQAKLTEDKKHFDYYGTLIISEIDFHHGITFYDPQVDPRTMTIHALKLGCDYNHYWDEGKFYTVESVQRDIQDSIDSFLDLVAQKQINISTSEENH